MIFKINSTRDNFGAGRSDDFPDGPVLSRRYGFLRRFRAKTAFLIPLILLSFTKYALAAPFPGPGTTVGQQIENPANSNIETVVQVIDDGNGNPFQILTDKGNVIGLITTIGATYSASTTGTAPFTTYTVTGTTLSGTTGAVDAVTVSSLTGTYVTVGTGTDTMTIPGTTTTTNNLVVSVSGSLETAPPPTPPSNPTPPTTTSGTINLVYRGAGGSNGDNAYGVSFLGITIGVSGSDGSPGATGTTVSYTVASNVSTTGTISSTGTRATAITFGTVGGNGGSGGNGYGINLGPYNGGAGGSGGSGTLTNNSAVATGGDNSDGIYAFSMAGSGGSGGSGYIGSGGGVGGAGGLSGGSITVTNNATITTNGAGSVGIFALSMGGAAGSGGDSYGIVGVGGSGSLGGTGGAVQVTNTGLISTVGKGATGILAQSIGGSGGSGGDSGGLATWGGTANSGGKGGNVSVTNSGTIVTDGEDSMGILAQSIGGGGGTSGSAYSFVNLGGSGGAGNDSGTVTIVNTSTGKIFTQGNDSSGIVGQSIGGGGGNTAYSVGAVANLGGSGAGGGNGSTVSITNNGTIVTEGSNSHGIWALSTGGGGGSAGSGGSLVDIGGKGGSGGNGGAVSVTNGATAYIQTTGTASYAIFAESIGGGGGSAGSASGLVSIGGSGTGGGEAGTVTVSNAGYLTTDGVGSKAILAQSIGGGGGAGGGAGGLVALGSSGSGTSTASGGDGAAVSVTNTFTATITTTMGGSDGIFAQSVGGGGGAGGSTGGLVAIGGSGNSGGNGGTVTVNNAGSITTLGDDSRGIFAQSVGGGGGSGGSGGALVALGGAGSAAGSASDVTVSNTGKITTQGDYSSAIIAESIGGGGGDGGSSSGVLTIGGGSDSGGSSGKVSVTQGGQITTSGTGAMGILAESVGGGGGNGGSAQSGSLFFGLALGGDGSKGGAGGTTQVVLNTYASPINGQQIASNITTHGDSATGILAQSVGGGGGNGGDAIQGTIGAGASVSIALGGAGGTASAGGTVTISGTGNVTTTGNNSAGIVLQSVGGGGGNGGEAVASSAQVGGVGGVSASVSVGGTGGAGGAGGNVSGTLTSVINTGGAFSPGFIAQSVGGGGGNGGSSIAASASSGVIGAGAVSVAVGGSGGDASAGGTVTISLTGSVTTAQDQSEGILIQSVGGGGGNGGMAIAGSAAAGFGGAGQVSVGLGGSGGHGGTGGDVNVAINDDVSTGGDNSGGVIIQSVGGGGGNGGLSVAGGLAAGGIGAGSINIGLGGTGGDGGTSGVVKASYGGNVTTTGDHSTGILVQSIGGGGGNGGGTIAAGLSVSGGGSGAISVGLGGDGGGAGNGGTSTGTTVSLTTTTGTVSTDGDYSSGIVVQSIGGGGGNGGYSIAAGASGATVGSGAIGVSLGGQAGGGGNGENVSANLASDVITGGDNSTGILVQSVGGGGGNGGYSIAAGGSGGGIGSGSISVGLGGSGGLGGTGGNVYASSSGDVTTDGANSAGFVTQSIGGGGGNGGFNVSGAISFGGTGSGAIAVGLGGSGGSGGISGTVVAINTGNIKTGGDNSDGVLAQSIGGGGGNGGFNVSGGASFGGVGSGGITVGLGGNGGAGQNAGDVTLTSTASITTSGTNSAAFVAQSLGGGGGNGGFDVSTSISGGGAGSGALSVGLGGSGAEAGNGGTVVAGSVGDISTGGDNSVGFLAQSQGGGGGNGGFNVSADISGASAGSGAIGVGLGGSGGAGGTGGNVTASSSGSITTTGSNSTAFVAQSLGGGGGNGGFNVSVALSGGTNSGGVSVGLGGNGGAASASGTVTATTLGDISTSGNNSGGILVESVGGGGGNGGFDVSVAGSVGAGISGALNVGLGGSGGGGGNGSTVSLTGTDNVTTTGNNAIGVEAQSVGGGGGNGGFNVSVSLSGGSGASGAIGVGLGGSGAGGGSGGTVSSSMTGSITTSGNDSTGLLVQSVGGGGGSGGFDVSAAASFSGSGSGTGSIGLGGSGAGGGNGGVVTSTQNGDVSTGGNDSSGVIVQSLGGGGGSGGFNVSAAISASSSASGGLSVGLGGSGGGGGFAGNVSGTVVGNVRTGGNNSTGILVQSAGGGGGAGGIDVSGALSFSGAGSGAVSVGLGGSGGGGGVGAVVVASETGSVTTTGTNSSGIIAQSLGGGGGAGGLNISGAISGASDGSGAVSVGLGGSGGTGGNANDVTNISNGDVSTGGDQSVGILTQSAGGGGGTGGLNVSGAFSYGGDGSGAISVGLGGSGGGGGNGTTVIASQTGNVTTQGSDSAGVIAQSMGGGGGAGGINISGGISISDENSAAITIGLGGSGGLGGISGTVTNTVTGNISTHGADSDGVLAQSVGGGGGAGGLNVSGGISLSGANSGAVSVGLGGSGGNGGKSGDVTNTVTGDIKTAGNGSDGVLAQSLGGGGGAGGINVSGDVNVGKTDGLSVGVGLGGSGGKGGSAGTVTSTVTGTTVNGVAQGVATSGNNADAIVAQSAGGGGGTGALNVTGGINITGGSSGSASVGIGGSGGGGGNGSDVSLTVNETGTIQTTGQDSNGIIAESIGGGGGDGGINVAGSLDIGLGFTGDSTAFAASIGVGGFGGSGGTSGTVNLSYNGPHLDVSDGTGILAQSVGGGGGNGAINVSGAISYGAGTNGEGYGLVVGVGGYGGAGGSASDVTVTVTGNGEITAGGSGAISDGSGQSGILAQSIGGGGGNGGVNISGGIVGTAPLVVGVGGSGGNAGSGGDVTLTGTAQVTITDTMAATALTSAGVFAQSIGGGGGNGGLNVSGAISVSKTADLPSITVGVGGSGGDGSTSGTVTVAYTGDIKATGYRVDGLLAQSIAGGGGNGGINVSGALTGADSEDSGDTQDMTIVAGVGGNGGQGDAAGEVHVTDTGAISTTGDNSKGLLAQSIGGGGGTGGMNITGNIAKNSSPISIGVGGSGDVGGNGDIVTVVRGSSTQDAGAITTNGNGATGLEAQSLGGGGGDAGMNFILGFSKTGSEDGEGDTQNFAAQFAIGGSGADAGNGDEVTVTNYSDITTLQDNSAGILAQSIGGGGGNATLNLAVTYAGANAQNMGFNFALGGSTGDGGTGGAVTVTSVGNITTSGANSYGILAQSIGGGGGNAGMDLAYSKENGGKMGITIGAHGGTGGYGSDVSLSSTGTVTTTGDGAYGLFAQSLGNGGGNSSTTSVGVEDTKEGEMPPEGASVAVGLEGGTGGAAGNVTIDSSGMVSTSGTLTYGIIAQSIGGGGGNGGTAMSLGLSSPTLGVSVGGTGGTGGIGGIVDVTNSAIVNTSGDGSIGIFAQSVGGGGGTGGLAISGGLGSQSGTSLSVAVGGSGGQAMISSNVTVNNTGNITTTGSNTASAGGADGILAQSIGGGGGKSGMVVITKLGATTEEAGTFSVGIGGDGGDGAISGTVTVNNTAANISTSGGDANGIFAQAVGGGGGIAADIISAQVATKGGVGSVGVNVGGTGGTGGAGGDVFVSNLTSTTTIDGTTTTLAGTISTAGDGANGILAMSVGGKGGVGSTVINAQIAKTAADNSTASFNLSIGGFGGGGGTGGTVSVLNAGTIYTTGAKADGIVALSIGGGGGEGGGALSGNIALGTGSDESPAINIAMGGAGGAGNYAGNVTVNNTGLIYTSGDESDGIFAESVGGGGGDGGLAVSLSNNIVSNPKTNVNFLSNAALGGFGGNGADGGNVTVTNSGTIVIAGNNSYGIYAQSVSGGGGKTGYSVSAPAWMLAADTFSYFLGGGSTGTAGSVNVSSTGTIITTGTNDMAIFSQSVNGGGGYISSYINASQQAVSLDDAGNYLPGNENLLGKVTAAVLSVVNVGSNWVQGAEATVEDGIEGLIPELAPPEPGSRPDPSNAGGAITSNTEGDTYTEGDNSAGEIVQTVGGGGGMVNSDVVVDDSGTVNLAFNLGETGTVTHTGDNGGDVNIQHDGQNYTFGNDSGGNIIQSIGGGGGTVFTGIEVVSNDTGTGTGSVTPQFMALDVPITPPSPNLTGTAVFGANGGVANSGGTVTLGNIGDSYTTGDRSFGLLIQSIGGGGGFADAHGYQALDVTLGGTGSASGNGSDITLTNTGTVTTFGQRADGIILQSIGGGGGLLLSDLDPGAITYTLSSANSGNGGNINFIQNGDVYVMGDDSIGILAQSLGGGGGAIDLDYLGTAGGAGTSGTVNLTLTGTVAAVGANGIAVFAQSEGRDGQGDITISLATGKTIVGGISNGVGVEMSGGATNTFINNGIVAETDAYGTAIIATDGNDTVKNYGLIMGSIDLGTGNNVYNNEVGSVLESGTFINLASNGTFYNAGTIAEGGFGNIQVTNVTGSYVQTGDAVWYNDISPTFTNDQFNISGDAKLGNYSNTVNLNQVTGVTTTSGSYTIITAATDLTGSFQFGTMTGFTMPNGLTYTFRYTDPAEIIDLLPSQGPFYWSGDISPVWNTDFVDGITNWTADATGTSFIYGTPGIGSDVYFASSLTSTINLMTMGENYTVNSLTVVAGASDVTMVGTETLTIAAAQGAGITLQNGAPTTTLFTNLELAGDQAWTNDSSNYLYITGTTVTSAGNHTLTVQGTGNTDIYSQIATGSGGLIKDGAGTLILYNPVNTYSGGTTIKGGILAVDTAGALGLGDVTNISGTLQTTENLGGVARTIFVAHNFSQMAAGTLLLQVVNSPSVTPSFDTGTPGTDYENVFVAGSAQLGGTLDLNFAPSTVVTPGQHYVVLTAGDPVTGHFIISTTTNLPQPYYTITTGNDTFNGTLPDNSAVVTLMKPFTSFSGLNPNQNNVAAGIDKDITDLNNGGYFALPNGTAAGDFFDNIVMGLNASIPQGGELARTLDELSPQRLELFRSVSFNNASFFSQQISGHMANERAGMTGLDTSGFGFNDATLGSLSQIKGRLMAWQPTPTPGLLSDSNAPLFDSLTFDNNSTPAQPWNTFIAGSVVLADINANGNVPDSNYTTGAVTAGADYRINKNWTVGALFGYSHTDAALDNEGSTATIDSYTPGIYASYADKGWYANGLFDYTYNGYTENRNIIFPGVNRTATGSPQGNQYNADLAGGYEFHLGHWTLGPSAGLDYVHLDIHSFAENGAGSANLSVREQTADSLRSRLGLETSYKTKYDKTDFGYHLGAYWQHEFMGNSTDITSSFQVPTSTAFTVYGPNPDRNTLLLDAGGDIQVLRNMDVFFDYSVQASQSQYFGQSVQAGVKIGF